jgi:hypothetical protein
MTMIDTKRTEQLIPAGIPRWIRCYDNGGETADRYTVVFTKKRIGGVFLYIGASAHPFDPQGFGQHGESEWLIDRPTYSHLGKRVSFDVLPPDVQKFTTQTYRAIWDLQS